MTTRLRLAAASLVLAGIAGVWLLFVALPAWYAPAPSGEPASTAGGATPTATAGVRKIKATLFYVSADGLSLAGVERDVPYGEGPVEQARLIVEEQLKAAPEPYASALPPGTTLRGLYLTDRGDAFVDLSAEVATAHSGGSLDELFTVYALVDALTTNLPAITAVQILVGGEEVDTLAGHVDLRHPLQKNLKWVEADAR